MFAPRYIIINGPSATFGSEFNIVKYGSSIFDKVSFVYNKSAIINDNIDVIVKDSSTSFIVAFMCINN